MTTSRSRPAGDPKGAYVWIWLPDATKPVVAGRLDPRADGRLGFVYGRSYLARPDAMPVYAPELPLRQGLQEPQGMLRLPSCIRDAAPDAWGRRVILNRMAGRSLDTQDLDELTYLLESGSDRIGALDFQASGTRYVPREATATLPELMKAADMVQAGIPLPPALEPALAHGTSIGGARPKALITDGTTKLIAKFSASNDTYGVVQGEFAAMRLAALAGLDVAPVRLVSAAGRFALLVERFDRIASGESWRRRALVSALTVLGLDEMEARYASYADLAEQVRLRFRRPKAILRDLFARIVWNVLVGNTDDHARNHAAFWDGQELVLTPAYDICPQPRTGQVASQAMLIAGDDRSSRIATCLAAAGIFGLGRKAAEELVAHQMETIRDHWRRVCDEAEMTEVDRRFFMGRQVLNRYAFDDLPPPLDHLRRLADEARKP